MSGFRRVKRGRYYSYELNGQRLPGVTTLIRDGMPKPALVDWAARAAAEYAADHVDDLSRLDRAAAVDLVKQAHRRTTNAAAAKGSEIHGHAQRLAGGESVDVPDALAGYVDGYLAFMDDWHPVPIAIEAGGCNRRWFYGGSFDLLATLAGQTEPDLIDVKTGGSGVWPETCLQVAAYRHFDSYIDAEGVERVMPATGAGYALWLADDGTYELLPLASGDVEFGVFLHVAHVAAFMGRKKDDVIGLPLEAPAVVAS
jgi:hypothetical protein